MNKIFFAAAMAFLASTLSAASPVKITKYQCSMHPQIIRDEPGDCPICGMHLVPIEVDAPGSPAPSSAVAQAVPMAVEGKAAYDLSLERQQLIGLRTETLKIHSVDQKLRLAARVTGGGVLAQLGEMDAGLVKSGMKAMLIGPDGSASPAVVEGVENTLDSVTRSFGVLLSPLERRAWMRAGVYAEARISIPLGKGIYVPEDAVIDTGERHVVFVRQGTRLTPRNLTVGPEGEGLIKVLSGLNEGEELVVSGNFFVDSEARFRAAASVQP